MKEIIFGSLAVLMGLGLTFWGYRLARIVIPLWGLFAGFTIGASAAADALGKNFIGTTLGIALGLVIGVVFALFAYFFFSLAIVLLGATVGYWIGTGFITMLGFNQGFLSAVVGISVGAIFAIICLAFNLPKYFLVVVSAIGGAIAAIGGIMLIFDKIPLDSFNYAAATLKINQSWVWTIIAVAIAIFGIIVQFMSTKTYELEMWGTIQEPLPPKKVTAKVQ